jgi:hypothetical protein
MKTNLVIRSLPGEHQDIFDVVQRYSRDIIDIRELETVEG